MSGPKRVPYAQISSQRYATHVHDAGTARQHVARDVHVAPGDAQRPRTCVTTKRNQCKRFRIRHCYLVMTAVDSLYFVDVSVQTLRGPVHLGGHLGIGFGATDNGRSTGVV